MAQEQQIKCNGVGFQRHYGGYRAVHPGILCTCSTSGRNRHTDRSPSQARQAGWPIHNSRTFRSNHVFSGSYCCIRVPPFPLFHCVRPLLPPCRCNRVFGPKLPRRLSWHAPQEAASGGRARCAERPFLFSLFTLSLLLILLCANRSLYHGGYLSTVCSSTCATDFRDERAVQPVQTIAAMHG